MTSWARHICLTMKCGANSVWYCTTIMGKQVRTHLTSTFYLKLAYHPPLPHDPKLTHHLPHGHVGLYKPLTDGLKDIRIIIGPKRPLRHNIVHEVVLGIVCCLLPAMAVKYPEEGVLDVLLVCCTLISCHKLVFHIPSVTLM